MKQKHFFLPCAIERGEFSSERVFEITVVDGIQRAWSGVSDVSYLRTERGEKLNGEQPVPGETIKGYVTCFLRGIPKKDLSILVEVPSGDTVYVWFKGLVAWII